MVKGKQSSKKQKREKAKEDFKESLDKHMPTSREGVLLGTFAGLTTLYYYGAQPIYEKLIVGGEVGEDLEESFAALLSTFLETNYQIVITEGVLNSLFPGGFLPGWEFGDVKNAVANAIAEEVPDGMTLDQTEAEIRSSIRVQEEKLRENIEAGRKTAVDAGRREIAEGRNIIALIRRVKAKVRLVRLMGAMGAAGGTIYFMQDYNVSQLIPGE